jgi:WD40 repeat protein
VSISIGPLLNTATDCLRFVTEFFGIISQSGPHIYHSALLLAPQSSVVWNLYSQQICSPISRVVSGVPTSWDSCTASTSGEVYHAVWSPCSQFIAAVYGREIQIQDSNTLESVSTLNLHEELSGSRFLAFSPNGCLLACLCWGVNLLVIFFISVSTLTSQLRNQCQLHIWVWDIQTGVIINNINGSASPVGGSTSQDASGLVFSGDSMAITVLWKNGSFWTYNTLKGTLIYANQLTPPSHFPIGAFWVHEESLRFSTCFKNNGKYVVNIQEFQPASTPLLPLSLIKQFFVPPCGGRFSFSPVSFHASFVTQTKATVLDVQDSRILLQFRANLILSGHFSLDGCFFACHVSEGEVHIWKNTSTGYIPWSNPQAREEFSKFSISPTMPSILTWGSDGIQLLEFSNCPSGLSPNKNVDLISIHHFMVAYSVDGAHIAMARSQRSAVTVLDTLSNTTQSFDAEMKIMDIKIVNSTIITADEHKLVSWHPETGEPVHQEVLPTPASTSFLVLSRDCSQIAFGDEEMVFLYDVQAQRILYSHSLGHSPVEDIRFSPDEHQLWFLTRNNYDFIEKLERGKDGKVVSVTMECPRGGWSWVDIFSPHGWKIRNESRCIEDSGGNRLLHLPLSWPMHWLDIRWDGNFLAFVACDLPDPIIIEFHP